MLTRRSLVATLAGGSAVAAAASQVSAGALALDVQTAAVEAPKAEALQSTLISNVMLAHSHDPGSMRFMVGLNVRMLTDFPDLFDRSLVMLNHVAEVRGQQVEAKARVLKTLVDLRPFTIDKTHFPPREVGEFYRVTAARIAEEILEERALLISQGKDICPCVPIAISGPRMHPETLAPVMAFQTRYGIWDHSWDRNVA